MKSIFDIIGYQINNLNLMTEFLESCNWDEDECAQKIQIVLDFFECVHLQLPNLNFEQWLDVNIKQNLIECGLTNNQAKIILKLIINSKEEIIMQQNLPEC